MVMRVIVCILLVAGAGTRCLAQYFQFSQYNFTPQRVNPATVASSADVSASFIYRNQSTDAGFHLQSSMINASYPFVARNKYPWSGIGISLMDDRSGQAGIFKTQEVALSYAVNVMLSKTQNLSFGIKPLYQVRQIDLDGLHTGSQYIPDRGFDESMVSGEEGGLLRQHFFSFSAGLYWQKLDKKRKPVAYWGFSFFDLNKPEDSFTGSPGRLHSTVVAMAGLKIYQQDNLTVFPEILFTKTSYNNIANIGFVTSYDIKPGTKKPTARIDVITKYAAGRSGVLGLQLHRENFSIGFSYDLPIVNQNVSHTGAFELALTWREHVKPKRKNKRKPAATSGQRSGVRKKGETLPRRANTGVTPGDSLTEGVVAKAHESLSTRLKHKKDSVTTATHAGEVTHEPLVLEKATLHFSFRFNSTSLDEEAVDYFDELAKALNENRELKVSLVGHTDNVGSDKFNLKLSLYRALAIRDHLIGKGVDAERIIIEGKGMREPVDTNETEEGRSRNRRVEMTILYQQ